jgi:alternative ribosome-rescue factor
MHDHKRGEIRDNAMAALVTSPMFKTQKVPKKTGKGSYKRKVKHQSKSLGCSQKYSIIQIFFERIPVKT